MTKRRIEDLACFGGRRLFRRPRSIGQLHRPDVEAFLAHVRRIVAESDTGGASTVATLERRLAALHGVGHCVAVANAGIGITLLLRLFSIFSDTRCGDVLLPAFSFRGLPHFARWAGQRPVFCDVDPVTHTLCPTSVEANVSERTTAILSVCNSNSPGDVVGLEDVARRHSVPLLFDSVYGLGATYRGRPLGGFGQAEVFSLHATKLLNGFEGGYVTTDDGALAAELRRQRAAPDPPGNAGGRDEPPEEGHLGLDATLNELHAAMALCALDDLGRVIDGNRRRHDAYRACLRGVPGLEVVPVAAGDGARSNYSLTLIDVGPPWPLTRDQTVAILQAENARITAYYSPPLHRGPYAPPGLVAPALPVTERLAERMLQVPVGERVSPADIRAIGALLAFVGRHGAPIRERLEAQAP